MAGFGVVVFSGAALGGMYLYQQSIPTLVTFGLRDGQVEVPVQEQLQLSASRPIAEAAMMAGLHLSPTADGQLRASADGRHFSWAANKPLADLTRYTLTLSPLRDASGHTVKSARWSFTTTIVPRVVSLTTEAGAAVTDRDAIPAGSRLRVSFNDAMDTASVKLLANGKPVGLSWAGDGRSASVEAGPLKIGALQLALADGSRDVAGRAALTWNLRASVIFEASIHTVPLRAPALVQIPNDPAARDQSGLQAADAVYEYDTEGDITRFTAVFTRAPDEVGPIRSGRLISFALTRQLHGMLFMSGLSEGSRARLAAEPVPHAEDLVPGIFHRTSGRRVPNNLFIAGASLQQNLERSGTRLPSHWSRERCPSRAVIQEPASASASTARLTATTPTRAPTPRPRKGTSSPTPRSSNHSESCCSWSCTRPLRPPATSRTSTASTGSTSTWSPVVGPTSTTAASTPEGGGRRPTASRPSPFSSTTGPRSRFHPAWPGST
jgi:hypothetical protein